MKVLYLSSEANTLSIENEINDEVQSCEMTLNQVYNRYILQCEMSL